MANESLGRYEILATLGRGGTGVVHRARGPEGHEVALKILHGEHDVEEATVKRFEREARIAMAIDHPNLVRALDAGRIDDRPFLASELVLGGCMSRLLSCGQDLPLLAALAVARDIAAGLEALAENELIHRDLKPSNVLLDLDGRARLADFGLARGTTPDRSRYTKTQAFVGTPTYVAPEQVLGDASRELDASCDLYSLGAILFQSVTGHAPYESDSMLQLLRQHVSAPVPDPRHLRPELDNGVAELIMHLLQKRPVDRPASAADVRRRLEELRRAVRSPAAAASLSDLIAAANAQDVADDPEASFFLEITSCFDREDLGVTR